MTDAPKIQLSTSQIKEMREKLRVRRTPADHYNPIQTPKAANLDAQEEELSSGSYPDLDCVKTLIIPNNIEFHTVKKVQPFKQNNDTPIQSVPVFTLKKFFKSQ
mmetsp:Transcript_29923/g.27387  ORF Transcript_29923/g.27387 Transcript_29923/m.27387 type:complete len:104 (-) Transcript_29923:302-613(-)|eukprot:CAMPEP_0114588198 /NCGR_PEP_ID=MMETSP0125-20121206/10965_1 /TAXON_ID=485358 ORGANISM="Aristerostoma sp., Strain ATCC 50986" /NCGR_SAMPLE_ID=MMETSP0125 /ASSEMBLY_ACC=CAM_ASM_000245 /LENGTH=103 /DNA_ID=CAMNT_0001784483 /DNA_START=64 /DNA_END=375 /DNA_ORIENTATION=+